MYRRGRLPIPGVFSHVTRCSSAQLACEHEEAVQVPIRSGTHMSCIIKRGARGSRGPSHCIYPGSTLLHACKARNRRGSSRGPGCLALQRSEAWSSSCGRCPLSLGLQGLGLRGLLTSSEGAASASSEAGTHSSCRAISPGGSSGRRMWPPTSPHCSSPPRRVGPVQTAGREPLSPGL